MSSYSFHNSHANTYDRMASGATFNIARAFLPTLIEKFPITKDSYVLDDACGTGIVSLFSGEKHPTSSLHSWQI